MLRSVLLLVSVVVATLALVPTSNSPLDDYVYKPDEAFGYQVIKTYQNPVVYTYILNMTSQNWLTTEHVTRTLWYHYLQIIVPQGKTVQQTALLFINGGSNGRAPPTNNSQLEQIAVLSESVVVTIGQIPNEPLTFTNDTEKSRTEDGIIAYCWRKFMETERVDWITRLPMVKAAVRAMDITQEIVKRYQYPHQVEEFVVAGASKRGWTTWLTAAVEFDKRVVGFIPMVIDVLDLARMFKHIHQELCGWPEAIIDYVKENITSNYETEQFAALAKIIDPIQYNERFVNVPKLVISASGDQFFPADLQSLTFEQVLGEKALRYVPNADHSLSGSDVMETIITYYMSFLAGKPRPSYQWKINRIQTGSLETAVIIVTVNTSLTAKPFRAYLWTADNENTRDFRVSTIGKAWRSLELYSTGKTHDTIIYEAKVEQPAKGFRAFMVELYWWNYIFPLPSPLKVTTPIYVTPDKLPCGEQ